nr:hypothetical protein [Desulfuromonadales bacterium]
YLEEDVPALEEEVERFLETVEEESADPEWEIQNFEPLKRLEEFPPEFLEWVHQLERLRWMQEGGYPFERDDLRPFEWQAMGILKRFKRSLRDEIQGEETD